MRLRKILELLERDFRKVLPQVELSFVRVEEWDQPPSTPSSVVAAHPVPEEVVLLAGGTSFSLTTSGGTQSVLHQAADRLQSEAMDHVHAAWPAVRVGERVAVLSAELDALGNAVWRDPEGFECPVGYLQQCAGRLGVLGVL